MSSEGVTLVMRAALVIYLIVVASYFRALADRVNDAASSCWPEPSAAFRSVCLSPI